MKFNISFKYYHIYSKYSHSEYRNFNLNTGFCYVKAKNGSWAFFVDFLGVQLKMESSYVKQEE